MFPRPQHYFEPRRHGSRVACGFTTNAGATCGARPEDKVHYQVKVVPNPWLGYRERREQAADKEQGQAMVEFALVLPILLLMLVGLIASGYGFLMAIDLRAAAYEGAVAGAMNPGDACGVAMVTARRMYAGTADTIECESTDAEVRVRLVDHLAFPAPFNWTITASQGAVPR